MTNPPIVLNHRIRTKKSTSPFVLLLSAHERTKLRGRQQTTCGQDVILQLPREGPLLDGDLLFGDDPSFEVLVKAATEELLLVSARSILELSKASYHLGNRHVELEIHAKKLFLLEDTVLEKMLKDRGLIVEKAQKPFFPELGAYSHTHTN